MWRRGNTPINIQVLTRMLQNYPDREISDYLIEGFSEGFRVQYSGPRLPLSCDNVLSADQYPEVLWETLHAEIELDRIAGPYKSRPMSNLRTSPIGLVLKDGGGWRLIPHLSFPEGNSVNDGIRPESSTVQYTSFDNVIAMISGPSKGALIGKMDIKSAFRLFPIYPGDFDLLGYEFRDQFFIDKCLPFGCSISCNIFEKFSTFLHWVVVHRSQDT